MSFQFGRFFFGSRPNGSSQEPYGYSPFTVNAQSGAKFLVTIALVLIGLGVFMLFYPRILAVIVASLFFLVALGCLKFAWRLYRGTRTKGPFNQGNHAEMRPGDEDRF